MMHLQGGDVKAILLSEEYEGLQIGMRPLQVGAFELLIQIAD
jgi:hypothetical protein